MPNSFKIGSCGSSIYGILKFNAFDIPVDVVMI